MSFAVATATTDTTAIIKALAVAAWVTDAGMDAAHLVWGNATHQPPVTVNWVRATILPGRSNAASWGVGGVNAKVGLVRLLIFGPKNVGDAPLNAIADFFIARFERQLSSGVAFQGTFGDGIDGPVPVPERSWATVRLDVPFHYWLTV